MKSIVYAVTAATAAFGITPAHAATVAYGALNPSGVITLTPAGPGAVSQALSFDVEGSGAFTAIFSFFNPFESAAAGGSAVFNFDPDVLAFTGGDISGGGTAVTVDGPDGASIQLNRLGLARGLQTLTLFGTLTPSNAAGGNGFARVGGQFTLTSAVVPEPASWALFIIGFGTIGAALRRRSGATRITRTKLKFA